MKLRGLVALALVAAAMATYLVIDGRRRPEVTERVAGRARLVPAIDWRAHLGRHIGGVDHVLHTDGNAVQRPSGGFTVARARLLKC